MYDSAGRVSSVTDQASSVTTYYPYLPNGPVSEVKSIDGNDVVFAHHVYRYDPNDNVKSVTSGFRNDA
jgi:hypothetical protein